MVLELKKIEKIELREQRRSITVVARVGFVQDHMHCSARSLSDNSTFANVR